MGSFTNLNDLYKEYSDVLPGRTSISDLMNQEGIPPPISFKNMDPGSVIQQAPDKNTQQPCTIRCTDILKHITTCPVCSKLYKQVTSSDVQENYSAPKESSDFLQKNGKSIFIFVVGILLIIILLLIKALLSK
jgi:hypothetical protein